MTCVDHTWAVVAEVVSSVTIGVFPCGIFINECVAVVIYGITDLNRCRVYCGIGVITVVEALCKPVTIEINNNR